MGRGAMVSCRRSCITPVCKRYTNSNTFIPNEVTLLLLGTFPRMGQFCFKDGDHSLNRDGTFMRSHWASVMSVGSKRAKPMSAVREGVERFRHGCI